MKKIKVRVVNKLGMHARSAANFASLADTFSSRVTVCHGRVEADGKNIIKLLLLAASRGAELTITANGEDEEKALAALGDLVASGFGGEDDEYAE